MKILSSLYKHQSHWPQRGLKTLMSTALRPPVKLSLLHNTRAHQLDRNCHNRHTWSNKIARLPQTWNPIHPPAPNCVLDSNTLPQDSKHSLHYQHITVIDFNTNLRSSFQDQSNMARWFYAHIYLNGGNKLLENWGRASERASERDMCVWCSSANKPPYRIISAPFPKKSIPNESSRTQELWEETKDGMRNICAGDSDHRARRSEEVFQRQNPIWPAPVPLRPCPALASRMWTYRICLLHIPPSISSIFVFLRFHPSLPLSNKYVWKGPNRGPCLFIYRELVGPGCV